MDVTLTAGPGRETGSRPMRRMRREGVVPGVLYGLGNEPVTVAVPWPDLRRALNTDAGLNALISLTVDGETNLTIIKDLHRDPVKRDVLHVDFQLIDRNKPLTIDVPVILTGFAPAVDAEKGIVDQAAYTISVNAKPDSIPTQLEVDISHLEIGSTVTVGEIDLPPGVTSDMDPETAVAVGSVTRSTIILRSGGDPDAEGVEGEEGTEGEATGDGETEASAGEAGDDGGGDEG